MDKKKYKTETRVKSSLPWGFYVFKYIPGRTLNPKGGHLFANIIRGEERGGWEEEAREKEKKKQQATTKETKREKNNVKKHRGKPTKKEKTKKYRKK